MAAAIAVDVAEAEYANTVTVSITGHTADTDYICEVACPDGFVHKIECLTDGSGDVDVTFVPQQTGEHTYSTRPAAHYDGTSTAEATATSRGLSG